MKNILLVVAFISLSLLGLLLVAVFLLGDFRPAFFPSLTTITRLFQKVEPTPSPVVSITEARISDPVTESLKIPEGFAIGYFAKKLGVPRDLEFSPEGTLLVSIPESGKVIALPDRDLDGVADEQVTVASGLNRPHGLAFFNKQLFIAEETRVVRYFWNESSLIANEDMELFKLPTGGRHRTRSLAFNKNGDLFVSIGSTCDVCEEKHEWLAAIVIADSNGANPRRFAQGLRNAVFIAVNPLTNELWGTEMGRDFLGDFTPPDEVNIITSNQNYGWPICWGDRKHDTVFDRNIYVRDPCMDTKPPQYAIPAHSAPLGLTFITSEQFPAEWKNDLLVAYHGSWNRSSPIGYKVVRLDLEGNTIKGETDFLTGFLQGSEAIARPVDVVFDAHGSLFVSDDKAGNVYKIIRSAP